MNNKSGLKQCNRVLLVTTLLILASSLQLEINSRTCLMGMDPYRDRHPVPFTDLPPHLPAFQME